MLINLFIIAKFLFLFKVLFQIFIELVDIQISLHNCSRPVLFLSHYSLEIYISLSTRLAKVLKTHFIKSRLPHSLKSRL